ncbi:MAG: WYL domain-containing protein, partial [Terriglobus sp.]
RKAIRTFRLDRVSNIRTGSKTFTRPQNFDARAYMAQSLPFVQSHYQVDVWIEMSTEEARQSFALWRIAVEQEQNGVRLRCGRDNLEMFAAMLLTINRRIVVHSPKELRQTFRDLAKRSTAAARNKPSRKPLHG